ncbi:hypothetical protein RIF29_12428 [Crotalaria pallida]|uniref:Uncharacterized protein n=1 Tax=Crotalaria pallida TaxID=3830 RepID=A0AAN9INB3_CROPI
MTTLLFPETGHRQVMQNRDKALIPCQESTIPKTYVCWVKARMRTRTHIYYIGSYTLSGLIYRVYLTISHRSRMIVIFNFLELYKDILTLQFTLLTCNRNFTNVLFQINEQRARNCLIENTK